MSMLKLIQDALENAIDRAKKVETYITENQEEMKRVAIKLEDLGNATITMTVDGNSETLDIALSGSKLQLQGLVHALRGLGYVPDNRPTEENITGWTTWWRNEDEDLRLYVSFYSTQCKRVKVGEKMVSQPIYETVCE